jgi:hypothetical protein
MLMLLRLFLQYNSRVEYSQQTYLTSKIFTLWLFTEKHFKEKTVTYLQNEHRLENIRGMNSAALPNFEVKQKVLKQQKTPGD